MNFTSLSFPFHQKYLIEQMRRQLDEVFPDTYWATGPVLMESKVLEDQRVSLNSLKEVYRVEEDKILRFDHTHGSLHFKKSQSSHQLNEKKFGPVFRKEPHTYNRYREFFQYDVDYVYEDHLLRPLKVLKKYLGPGFRFVLNDTSLGLTSDESLSDQRHLESHTQKFYTLHPQLRDLECEVSPHLRRGWDYYKGLVFEVFHEGDDKRSVCGGGTYGDPLLFGFGIGVNRLLNVLLKNEVLMDRFLPRRKLVLVRHTGRPPENLLDALDLEKVPYHLKRVRKSLYKDFPRIEKELLSVNRRVVAILTVSLEEDLSRVYHYKLDLEVKEYTLEDLLKVLKTRVFG